MRWKQFIGYSILTIIAAIPVVILTYTQGWRVAIAIIAVSAAFTALIWLACYLIIEG